MSEYDQNAPQDDFQPSQTTAPADEPEEFDFTEAHIAAATRAHANGKVVVIDRGPSEPKPAEHVEGERTDAEIEADNRAAVLAKREHDDWHAKHKEPVAIAMDKIDADHAVNADPKRYVHVPRSVREPVTVEERLTRLEQRLGPETPEEIEHRRDRDKKLATERAERAKAKKAD
jgi:hypothetical protein